VAALLALLRERWATGAVMLAATVAAKLFAIALLPVVAVYVWRRGDRKALTRAAVAFSLATIVLWGPFLALGAGGVGGLLSQSTFRSWFRRISIEQWRAILATNLDGVYHTCRAVLRPMMKARYGRIVNMSALHAVGGGPGQADYSAATGGVLGITRALAREAAAWSITVNAVTPGLVETEMLDVMPQEERDWGERVIALRRSGRPEEIAAAIIFLASPLASYITGQTLAVDGGWRMT